MAGFKIKKINKWPIANNYPVYIEIKYLKISKEILLKTENCEVGYKDFTMDKNHQPCNNLKQTKMYAF